jgi:Lrp/AsnC family leucine-responsive transcriptional regulator
MQKFRFENPEKTLDSVDWQILCELQQDARLSYAEIGRRVGMSAPAVMERVRRLEDAGIIGGYTVRLDVARLGLPIQAIVRVRFPGDRYPQMLKLIKDCPEILECHHVTGDDCLVMKIAVASVGDLEPLIGRLGSFGQTTTSIILSSPVTERLIDLRPAEPDGSGRSA